MPALTMTGIHRESVECMIQAMYTGDYFLPTREKILSCRNVVLCVPNELANAVTEWPLTRHARVFAVASQYEVAGLRQLACDRYQIALHASLMDRIDFLESLFDVFMRTPKSDSMLRQMALDFIVDTPGLIWSAMMEAGVDDAQIMHGITDTRFRRLLAQESLFRPPCNHYESAAK